MAELAEKMTDNEALRRILTNVREIEEDLRGASYDSVSGSTHTLDPAGSQPFASDANSVKVVILNTGANACTIKEDGVTVAVLIAGATYISPLGGRGAYTVSSTNGTTISFARYRKD